MVLVLCFPQADAGGSGTVSRRFTGQGGSEHFVMKIASNKVYTKFLEAIHGCYFVFVSCFG